MHILIVSRTVIPVVTYGGTERVIWDLGIALKEQGHRVTYLVSPGSSCDFAPVIHLRDSTDLRSQIPKDVDVVHFHFKPDFDLDAEFAFPYLFTEHGNSYPARQLPLNSVFLSRDHAKRHGSTQFVYNGLNWQAYGTVDFDVPRVHYHFLGKGAWRVKNLSGAIKVARQSGERLAVLGGTRLNFKRGFRFTFSPSINFFGMVGGELKRRLLNESKGLIFPVRWHEPFGLAVIESLYFGCPVFATPYGSLPELVTPEEGVLSTSSSFLAAAVKNRTFDPRACHDRALREFSSWNMATTYVAKYQEVLGGGILNQAPPQMTGDFKDLPWT